MMMDYAPSRRKKKETPLLPKLIFIFAGILFGFIVGRFFFIPFHMGNNAMIPNIKQNDKLLFSRFSSLKRGDIILLEDPIDRDKYIVKRLLALPGDKIEIRNKNFYINGKIFRFSWKKQSVDSRNFPMNFSGRDNLATIKLSKENYFFINDNLDLGFDSRFFGVVKEDYIKGKLFYNFK